MGVGVYAYVCIQHMQCIVAISGYAHPHHITGPIKYM